MELMRALAVLAEPPGAQTSRLCDLLELPGTPTDWEYTELFVTQLVPYASVYLGEEGRLGGEASDRIAGFWRVLGETPPAEPDHLAVLLGLYAQLCGLEASSGEQARTAWSRARATLLHEHLTSWLPLWLAKVAEIGSEPYRAWGALLSQALRAESARTPAPPDLPLHLRQAPPLEAPQDVGGSAFLQQLLTPVRVGMILTRADLARGARELGLGLRAGERLYALRALLAQDEAATLGWLADAAAAAAAVAADNAVDRFWRSRAARAATCLRAAAR